MGKDQIDTKVALRLAWMHASHVERVARALDEDPEPSLAQATAAQAADDLDAAAEPDAPSEATRMFAALSLEDEVTAEELGELLEALEQEHAELPQLAPGLAVQLGHFLLAHRDLLDDEQRESAADCLAMAVDPGAVEVESLLLELVRVGDAVFCESFFGTCLAIDVEPLAGLPRRLGRQLHELVRNPKTPAAGVRFALQCLDAGDWPIERAAVQPWLRGKDWVARAFALALLSDSDQLQTEDLLFLCEEACDTDSPEPFVWDADFDADAWNDRIREGIVALRPPEVEPHLRVLAERRAGGERMHPAWAMQTLAEAFPGSPLPSLEPALRSFKPEVRQGTLGALKSMPLDQAQPLLASLCNDPVPSVARAAQDLYLERTHRRPPIDPLASLPPGCLQAPPSERLLRRLAIAREPSEEGRLMLRDLLLSEARAGTATPGDVLVLLALLCDRAMRKGGPEASPDEDTFEAWVVHLESLCGEQVSRGVVALARRFPDGDELLPLRALLALHRAGRLDPVSLAEARGLAMDSFVDDPERAVFGIGGVLRGLGAVPERWEELYPWALKSQLGHQLAVALMECGPVPALDARILEDLGTPLPFEVRCRLLAIAVRRAIPGAVGDAQAALAQAQTLEEVKAALDLVAALLASGAVEPERFLRELSAPHLPRFLLGAGALRPSLTTDPRVRAAFEAALSGCAAAAECAVVTLVGEELIAPGDPRVLGALDALEAWAKATVLYLLLRAGIDPALIVRQVAEVLHGDDPDAVEFITLALQASPAGKAVLAGLGAAAADA